MKQTFKFFLMITTCISSLLIFSSCKDDEDETSRELLFTVETNTNPGSVSVDYHHPGPATGPISYAIYANHEKSELILKCTNSNDIYIEQILSSLIEPEFSDDQYINSQCGWTISVVNGNELKIEFEEMEIDPDQSPFTRGTTIVVCSKDKINTQRANILIDRNLEDQYYFQNES